MESLKDINAISNVSRILSSKEDIKRYVEKPLIPMANYLYDLNILTTMTSANLNYNRAYIIIDYDTLSEENKEIANSLLIEYPKNCQKRHFSMEGNNMEFCVEMPINQDTTLQEIHSFFYNIFKGFKIQEIFSIYDFENLQKNIYSKEDAIIFYLMIAGVEYFNQVDNASYQLLIEEDRLDEHSEEYLFLKQLGGNINYTVDKDNLRILRYGCWSHYCSILKTVLKINKEKLFLGKVYNVEEANIEELLKFLHTHSSKELFFNESDERFYLNEELLKKHYNFLDNIRNKENKR